MLEAAFWNDRLLFLLLSAGAMGVVSVVLWDTLFPGAARRVRAHAAADSASRVQMLGRLGGLLVLFAGFTVGLNAIPAVAFPVVSAGGSSQMPRGIVGHFVAAVAADALRVLQRDLGCRAW